MRLSWLVAAALLGFVTQVRSQEAAPVAQADLDLAVKRGSIATLAPLCKMRDEKWAEDLRRAAMQDATRATMPDDPSLKSASGSDLAAGALGFADAEALEDFAEASPLVACGKLAHDPGLQAADRRVADYRKDLARTQRVW
jgi:hypothetical protein